MSQPPPPSDEAAGSSSGSFARPAEPQPAAAPAPGWTAPPAPLWAPAWEPPAAAAPPAEVLSAPPSRRLSVPRPVGVALAAACGALLGAAVSALLVTAFFSGSAEEIGREIAAEVRPAIEEGFADASERAMDGVMGDAMSFMEEETAEYGAPAGPVEQFDPVEPGDLGPDPVLDDYADSCFEGGLQFCDDLFNESPPMSDYERYAATCGGRVKEYSVMSCTELD